MEFAGYENKSWTIQRGEKKRVQEFDTWCYRIMLRIRWRVDITNEDAFRRAREDRSFLENIKCIRDKLIVYIVRLNGIVKSII